MVQADGGTEEVAVWSGLVVGSERGAGAGLLPGEVSSLGWESPCEGKVL